MPFSSSMRTSLSLDSSEWPDTWKAAYRILEQTVLPNQLQAWIQPLEFIRTVEENGGLTVELGAPNDFSAQWVRDHCQRAIESSLTQVMGVNCELRLTSKEHEKTPQLNNTDPLTSTPNTTGIVLNTGTRITGGDHADARSDTTLEPKYTFDTFVVGASNQFAYASAVAVAEQPARQYNPLFIYSHPGLGKTHLLHAIGNHILVKNPGSRVAYLSAERFVNELIDSLQHNRMPAFRAKFRDSYDMILIDDIQFIAGKVKTEEEFFHTFNALHSTKRQIVLTSDRPPKEIEGLEERIRTRFEWGLISDIHPPEIETRIAILKSKAEREDVYLPDDVATFLASYIKTNVRELEGVLIRLQAQASLTGAEISLEMAKMELKTAIPEEGSHLTVEAILNAVAKHFHLKSQDFRSTTRSRNVALPRQIAMYLIRKYTGLGFKEIGQYFGGKDHTTILHAYVKVEKGLDSDTFIRESVESIQNLL
jgi:chromosomal replication initiator protein